MTQTPLDPRGEGAGTMTGLSWSPRGVTHPLWLASLALLVVNDHFLKGAGLLPGGLTGKLSDFAGLIVAPVLLAVIVRARRAWARAAACALVAGGFVAIKLWPAAARMLEQAFALAHVRARVWCDPTDLVALLVLPAAWWLTSWRARVAWPAGAARRVFERASVIAGALACLATQGSVIGHVWLINQTEAPLDIAVYYRPVPPAEPLLDCPAVEAGDLTSLGPASFGAAGCQHVEPGARVVLGSIMYDEPDGGRTGCGAALIRAVGLPDTVLTWRAAPAPSESATEAHLEGTAGNLQIAGTGFVAATPAAFTPRPSNCPGIP